MFRNNDSLKYSVNELMKGLLDPGFDWTELEIKQGAVIEESQSEIFDHSENAIPSGPLNAEDYPVVPESLSQYCTPPKC